MPCCWETDSASCQLVWCLSVGVLRPLLGKERGMRQVQVCSLPSHPSTETGGEEILREGSYSALLLSLLTSEQVSESEAGAGNIYRATSRRH